MRPEMGWRDCKGEWEKFRGVEMFYILIVVVLYKCIVLKIQTAHLTEVHFIACKQCPQ